MTCKCGSTRVIEINAKCSDLCGVQIPHMDIDYDGYMPSVSKRLGGGDYVELTVCLDCGQIPNWTPVTDDDIRACEEFDLGEQDGEEELPDGTECGTRPDPRNKDTWYEPEITKKDIEKQRITKLMVDAYGPLWQKDEEALDVLRTTLEKDDCGPALTEAIKEFLNGH